MSSEDKRRRSRRISLFDNLDRIVDRFLAEARYIGINRPYRRVVPFMPKYSIRIGSDGKPIVKERVVNQEFLAQEGLLIW